MNSYEHTSRDFLPLSVIRSACAGDTDTFTFALDKNEQPLIQELRYENGICKTDWREPRSIPEDDDFFENVWRSYRETGNIQ